VAQYLIEEALLLRLELEEAIEQAAPASEDAAAAAAVGRREEMRKRLGIG
jgi:hypothetical protein